MDIIRDFDGEFLFPEKGKGMCVAFSAHQKNDGKYAVYKHTTRHDIYLGDVTAADISAAQEVYRLKQEQKIAKEQAAKRNQQKIAVDPWGNPLDGSELE
ncbi:MAG: hypothetical protein ACOCP4_00850 [Candidatus Woesearchaeota archaeon]